MAARGGAEDRTNSVDQRADDVRGARIVVSWAAGDMERTQRFAMELIALRPDVAVVMSAPALVVMQRETGAVPIVFVQVSDPVGSGFVASMSRPGGNITGFANFETSMASKWIELLKEVAPHVSRIAFLIHAGLVPHLAFWRAAQNAAGTTWPLAALAQQAERVRQVGVLIA